MKTTVTLQPETQAAVAAVPANVISGQALRLGIEGGEPLLLALDGFLRYAKAHEKRFGDKLCEDYVLGPSWLKALVGVRELLNGDGAVAHERNITTDSKDNGACEAIFWAAMNAAGFTEKDI